MSTHQPSSVSASLASGDADKRSAISEMLKNSTVGRSTFGPVVNMAAEVALIASNLPPRDDAAERASSPTRHSNKARSLSDPASAYPHTPVLSPSPNFKEQARGSKDDHDITSPKPRTPHRPDFLGRGLSLLMPAKDDLVDIQGLVSYNTKGPLSPKIDKSHTYESLPKVLPRHSRGLDFSRACTNLHHSTLAEKSSPDSSPTINQRGMMIPHRRTSNSMAVDPPQFASWSVPGQSERSVVSSSLGSVNMLGSDSEGSSDDDMEPMDHDEVEDAVLTTPQVHKYRDPSAFTPFACPTAPFWPGMASPGVANFTNFHRQRLRKGRSRKSSSSASGHSNMASPAPQSPPNGKTDVREYYAREVPVRGPAGRRESLSMHTHDHHISSGNDSGDETGKPGPSTPGVVRRAVTRRGNLLPKIRAFGRVRAELLEETMPVDAEVKKEAEVLRQVRESDPNDIVRNDSTAHSSPSVQAVNSLSETLGSIPETDMTKLDNASAVGFTGKGLFGAFARQASSTSGGKDFWNAQREKQCRTPPPSTFHHGSSSVMSDDVNMESPTVPAPSTAPFSSLWQNPKQNNSIHVDLLRASTAQAQNRPQASSQQTIAQPPSAADGLRKANKRRRDDDLDLYSIKRRAVSPGVSVGNSPILCHSPSQRAENIWGRQEKGKEGTVSASHGHGERSVGNETASVQQTPLLGPKRVGLQGMNDMQGLTEKMSIE